MTRVRELFDVEYGHSLALNRLSETATGAGVAFISRTARNNGIAAWVDEVPGIEPLPAGLLTVCLRSRNHSLATFLQPHPFYCGYHIFVLRPIGDMPVRDKLWWAQCIAANRYRYNFGRQANRSLADLELPGQIPAWVQDIEVPDLTSAQNSAQAHDLMPGGWEEFSIGSLFDVVRGRNVLKRDMKPGGTPYVSAAAVNNGVSAWLDIPPDHEEGAITVASNGNGGVGSAFYQPRGFIASGDVTVLKPKTKLSEAASLFICTLIYAERYRWNYWRKWGAARMRESVIKLPSTPYGQPDWDYIESYIRELPLADVVLDK